MLALLPLAAYFAFRSGGVPALEPDNKPVLAAREPSPTPKKLVDNLAPPKPKSVATAPAPTEDDRPENVVSFVVEEGVAIAFGDVILGAPEQEGIKTGFYQLAPPTPWETPEIPYAINGDVDEPERVLEAIRHIEKKTGVHFVLYVDQPDGILFQKGPKDCWSTLGRQGGLQPIRIARRCGWKEITHEVLHAFGFLHEQSRFDRDNYVEVLWDNIDREYRPQFERLPRELLGGLVGKPFDYHSVMLYNTGIFAKDKQPNMRTKTAEPIAPSEDGLSELDIAKVKALFRLD